MNRAFTLIELIVVITIIAILAVIHFPVYERWHNEIGARKGGGGRARRALNILG